MNSNKELKIQRMKSYFIDATNQIIQEDGIEAITARKVSNRAGYNVSTLYNYFDNLDHLLSVSLTGHIGTFVESIIKNSKNLSSPYDMYRVIWFEFAKHAFKAPVVYYYIFFKNPDSDVSEVFDAYFSENEDTWDKLNSNMRAMFSEKNIFKRDILFLELIFPEVDSKELQKISEINILVYKAMLYDLQLEKIEKNKIESIKNYEYYFVFLMRDLK